VIVFRVIVFLLFMRNGSFMDQSLEWLWFLEQNYFYRIHLIVILTDLWPVKLLLIAEIALSKRYYYKQNLLFWLWCYNHEY